MANMGYLQVLRICNQKCLFCSNPENGLELSLEDAKKLVDEYVELNYDGVIITGGEPTLYAPLFDLISYVNSRNLGCRMITNGQKTADRNYLVALIKAGLAHINVSIHSHKPKVQNKLSQNPESLQNIVKTLVYLKNMPITVNINQTICKQNADHVHQTIQWLIDNFPNVNHLSWTYLDPYMNRVKENPGVIPKLKESEESVLLAMRILDESGRTFRMEKLPLCYMGEFAHCSTETRAIVKKDERIISFLDERKNFRESEWTYQKGKACKSCSLNNICAGLWDMGGAFSEDELTAQNTDPELIIEKILQDP